VKRLQKKKTIQASRQGHDITTVPHFLNVYEFFVCALSSNKKQTAKVILSETKSCSIVYSKTGWRPLFIMTMFHYD